MYDFIVIDTPACSERTYGECLHVAADHLIIPMVPEILSLLGVSQLRRPSFAVHYNSKLSMLGILLTKYNGRTILARSA